MRKYYRDDPNDDLVYSESFSFKVNITGKTPDTGNTKNVKIAVSLKYLINFWITLIFKLKVMQNYCNKCDQVSKKIGK